MQFERHIAHGMGQIKSASGPHPVGRLGNGFHVVQLPRVVVHAADHHGGELVTGVGNGLQHVLGAQQVLAFPRGQFDQIGVGVAPVQTDLAAQGIAVAREGLRFAQQLSPGALGLVKADQQQVEVDREPIHGHHFVGVCACQMAEALDKPFVVVDPRMATLKVAFHPQRRPVFQLDLQGRLGVAGLKS